MSFPNALTNPAQANGPVIVNENLTALGASAMYARNYATSTGLVLGYFGGHIAGSAIADNTTTLAASEANVYVVAHRTTGAVTSATNTTNWNATGTYGRLYHAVTGGSTITTLTDWREQTGGWFDKSAAGGFGDALVANPLSQFAATTSAQLAGVISDETGSGALVFGTAPTLSNPVVGTQAANDNSTKAASTAYVDSSVSAALNGLSWKQAVRAATTAAVTLATDLENGDSIDGVTLATGNRILVKNQAAPAENGIYVVAASGAPTRATDADSGAELVNASVYVSEGTTLADTQWTCTTNATITVGVTGLVFAQLTSSGSMALDDLTDVDATGPSDGDVLTFDSGSGDWVAAAPTGGGGSTQGLHDIWLDAGSWHADYTAPPTWGEVNGASDQPDTNYWTFDPTTEQAIWLKVRLPKSYNNGTFTFQVHWWHPTAATFDVVWSCRAVAFSNGDALAANYGTAQTSIDSGATASTQYVSPESSAITIAGTPAAGDLIFIELRRKPADGSDTLNVGAGFYGARIQITTNADTDA
jgi:hypothetical protein